MTDPLAHLAAINREIHEARAAPHEGRELARLVLLPNGDVVIECRPAERRIVERAVAALAARMHGEALADLERLEARFALPEAPATGGGAPAKERG